MKKLYSILLSFAAATLLTPGILLAGDYCISFPGSPGFAIVGKAFTVPAKNKCKTWAGFYVDPSAFESATSGVGCVSADNSHLLLTLTTTFPQISSETTIDSISLALPSQSGNDNESTVSDSGTSTGAVAVQGGKCNPVIPVPTVSEAPHSAARTAVQNH